jgi:CRISPR-associated protein Cst2
VAHLSGLILIDCPASALNNAGQQLEMVNRERRYDNWSTIKKIETRQGVYPYVSAQAFRYWMRETLKDVPGWTSSPTFREEKIAYTDANPILYAEDDLFGYMRAPGGGKEGAKSLQEKWAGQKLTEQEKGKAEKFIALTRVSPFKVSTLMSIAGLKPGEIGFDYGTMARTDDPEYPNPVPYVHEFYRATLAGLFSIDLRMLGRFYFVERTGFRHLDSVRKKLAEERGLESYDNGRAYQLDLTTRKQRLAQLLEGLARINGGAKQAVHYTDLTPRLILLGVAKGGNHLFGTAVGEKNGLPVINTAALAEASSLVWHRATWIYSVMNSRVRLIQFRTPCWLTLSKLSDRSLAISKPARRSGSLECAKSPERSCYGIVPISSRPGGASADVRYAASRDHIRPLGQRVGPLV